MTTTYDHGIRVTMTDGSGKTWVMAGWPLTLEGAKKKARLKNKHAKLKMVPMRFEATPVDLDAWGRVTEKRVTPEPSADK